MQRKPEYFSHPPHYHSHARMPDYRLISEDETPLPRWERRRRERRRRKRTAAIIMGDQDHGLSGHERKRRKSEEYEGASETDFSVARPPTKTGEAQTCPDPDKPECPSPSPPALLAVPPPAPVAVPLPKPLPSSPQTAASSSQGVKTGKRIVVLRPLRKAPPALKGEGKKAIRIDSAACQSLRSKSAKASKPTKKGGSPRGKEIKNGQVVPRPVEKADAGQSPKTAPSSGGNIGFGATPPAVTPKPSAAVASIQPNPSMPTLASLLSAGVAPLARTKIPSLFPTQTSWGSATKAPASSSTMGSAKIPVLINGTARPTGLAAEVTSTEMETNLGVLPNAPTTNTSNGPPILDEDLLDLELDHQFDFATSATAAIALAA